VTQIRRRAYEIYFETKIWMCDDFVAKLFSPPDERAKPQLTDS